MTQPNPAKTAQLARDDLYDALDQSWYRWDPQSMAKGTGIIRLIDAHAAEVRAATLREAADELTAACPDHGTGDTCVIRCQCDGADVIRRLAGKDER